MLQFVYNPPKFNPPNGFVYPNPKVIRYVKNTWAGRLIEIIEDLEDDKLSVILKHMVTESKESRFTADQCLQLGCMTGLFQKLGGGRIEDAEIVVEVIPDDRVATPTQHCSHVTKKTSTKILAECLFGSEKHQTDPNASE